MKGSGEGDVEDGEIAKVYYKLCLYIQWFTPVLWLFILLLLCVDAVSGECDFVCG